MQDVQFFAEDLGKVGGVLDTLVTDCPALRDRVLDENGALLDYVNVPHDGTMLTDEDLRTTLKGDDERGGRWMAGRLREH